MDLDYASRREWLETNGIGGYASSTLAGLNTRRYHGLLVAATSCPMSCPHGRPIALHYPMRDILKTFHRI